MAEVASALLIFWAACAMLPVSNAIAAAWGECGECLESKLRAGELSWADIYRTAADVALQELRPRLLLANGLAHISTVPGRVAVQICKQHGTCTEEGTGAADVQRHGNRLQL